MWADADVSASCLRRHLPAKTLWFSVGLLAQPFPWIITLRQSLLPFVHALSEPVGLCVWFVLCVLVGPCVVGADVPLLPPLPLPLPLPPPLPLPLPARELEGITDAMSIISTSATERGAMAPGVGGGRLFLASDNALI